MIVLLHALVAAVLMSWWQALGAAGPSASHGPWLAVVTLGGGLAGLATARRWPHRTPALRWTGLQWQLADGTLLQRLDLQIDAGVWVLLRAQSPRGVHWLVASRAAADRQWHGLRVALQAHAGQSWPLREAMR